MIGFRLARTAADRQADAVELRAVHQIQLIQKERHTVLGISAGQGDKVIFAQCQNVSACSERYVGVPLLKPGFQEGDQLGDHLFAGLGNACVFCDKNGGCCKSASITTT